MTEQVIRSDVATDNPVPTPPFWGTKVMEHIPVRALIPYINKTMLYQFQWGYKKKGQKKADYWAWAKQEVDPIFNDLLARVEREQIQTPQAVYGYFPCQSEGNDIVLYKDPGGAEELQRFTLPRQDGKKHLCIADFFRSVDSGEMDVIGLQVVTVGQHASDVAREWFNEDKYTDYLYLHGLNVETTEALAEWVHKQIRAELGFSSEDARDPMALIKQGYRGSRYSFGYPACPNLEDQRPLLEIMEADRLGITMADEQQMHPEESTSAIVAHHPEAKYFSV
ncbi:MAG TPA: vitamin B12 dependent-methionine synthase activation domain-containing protein [Gammaproteobacteria bacterium]|nr:vitamin B12 dependent-methionine synthase activation domain-containing protein [Gammaproteobacteria bacterium]